MGYTPELVELKRSIRLRSNIFFIFLALFLHHSEDHSFIDITRYFEFAVNCTKLTTFFLSKAQQTRSTA